MPRNNENGNPEQRIPHGPQGAETTEFRDTLFVHEIDRRPVACRLDNGPAAVPKVCSVIARAHHAEELSARSLSQLTGRLFTNSGSSRFELPSSFSRSSRRWLTSMVRSARRP